MEVEEQALPGKEVAADDKRVTSTSRRLAEGRELLERMQFKSMGDFHKYQRDLQSQTELVKWMEEQHLSWTRERESMESELRKLRSEVAQLQAAAVSQICDIDRGSEEIDLKAVAEHKWNNASRQALAPITPEAVKARTRGVPTSGKENYIFSDMKCGEGAEEMQRLRRENEHYKEKASRLSKENKGLKSQYNYLQTRLGSKGDVGQLIPNQDHLQAALEVGLEKPSKIRRRSPGETQTQGGDARSPSPVSSDMNGPSTPVPDSGILPPQAVAEVVITRPTASTSGSREEVKTKPPMHFESSKAIILLPKNKTSGNLDAGVESKADQAVDNSAIPTPMAGNRKRSLEPSGKQPAKTPAYKFVEPVRKKADRENLQGTECKLCKKFYDAVAAGDAQGMAASRCNHHKEISRHRFRDLPPATPEGFWNIGFDSQ